MNRAHQVEHEITDGSRVSLNKNRTGVLERHNLEEDSARQTDVETAW